MITSIIRYHTANYYIMPITRYRFRPYWVSSGGCKKHSIINMLKKNKFFGDHFEQIFLLCFDAGGQRRSSRPPNPPIGGRPRPTLGAQVSLKLLFGYVTIFSSADLFTTDLNCRKKLACDIISECNVILSRRI